MKVLTHLHLTGEVVLWRCVQCSYWISVQCWWPELEHSRWCYLSFNWVGHHLLFTVCWATIVDQTVPTSAILYYICLWSVGYVGNCPLDDDTVWLDICECDVFWSHWLHWLYKIEQIITLTVVKPTHLLCSEILYTDDDNLLTALMVKLSCTTPDDSSFSV